MVGAPFGDVFVVTGEEDGGDFVAAEVVGLSVLGIFEVVAVTEAFDFGGLLAAKNAGNEADDGIDDDECGELAAGEDVVAEGEFVVDYRADALVVAFVVGAEYYVVIGRGPLRVRHPRQRPS